MLRTRAGVSRSGATGVINRALLGELERRFAPDWHGIHDIRHWGRVRLTGLVLAGETGANPRVVELFAVFHDACRFNDGHDPAHGARGAALATALRSRFFNADDDELDLLTAACDAHSDGHTSADVTVMTCRDADRLDLGRFGIRPDPRYLCTSAAKRSRIIARAHERSVGHERHASPARARARGQGGESGLSNKP